MSGLLGMLREELAPRPGRLASCLRISAITTIGAVLVMLYRVPEANVILYIILFINGEDATSTLVTGVVAGISGTLALGLTLVCFAFDIGELALRLPLMALLTFVGLFCTRTMTIGPAAFLATYVLVFAHTLVDRVPSLEALTHLILWLWITVMLPVTLTVLANLVAGEKPAATARRTVLQVLGELEEGLRDPSRSLEKAYARTAAAVESRHRADLLDRDLRGLTAIDLRLFETLGEQLALRSILPEATPPALRDVLARACASLRTAFEQNIEPDLLVWPEHDGVVVGALIVGFDRLRAGLVERRHPSPAERAAPEKKALFVPGAFAEPTHLQFAIKGTIAVMAAYTIYNGLAWPGINTAVTTCFFVTLATLGETLHKLTLRIVGALLGGGLAGVCIAFVQPHMVDIGDLAIFVAVASFGIAWLATTSARLSYAGLQVSFAFYLGFFQGFGPPSGSHFLADTSEFTVLRDRVVGILLGNVLVTIVFSVLWPTSAAKEGRKALGKALAALGKIAGEEHATNDGLAVLKSLVQARHFLTLAAFENRVVDGPPVPFATLRNAIERLAGAVFAMRSGPRDEAVERWFHESANHVTSGLAAGLPPLASAGVELASTIPIHTEIEAVRALPL